MNNINIKKILFFLITLINLTSYAESLKIKWYGTTCLTISDGKSIILFDPFFTRPTITKLITFSNVKSDEKIVKNWLKNDLAKISAIFVSHTHYDHVLDLGTVARLSSSNVYGSQSMVNIAKGNEIDKKKIKLIKKQQTLTIGDFKVTVLSGVHPPHLWGFMFADGVIEQPLTPESSPYSYKVGESFNFYIEHPRANILFHPTAIPFVDLAKSNNYKANVLIIGISKRKSSADIIEKLIRPLKPKIVIPVHQDDFFRPLSEGKKLLGLAKYSEFKESVMAFEKNILIPELDYGEVFSINK